MNGRPYADLDDSGRVLLDVTVSRPDGQAAAVTLAVDPEAYPDLEPLERFRTLLAGLEAVLLWACGDERYRLTPEGLAYEGPIDEGEQLCLDLDQ